MQMWKRFGWLHGRRRASRDFIRQLPDHAHLGEALNTCAERVRSACRRDRRYIKEQKYTLLSRRENLTLDGKKALRTLLAATSGSTRHTLKESFGQLWNYERDARAWLFLRNGEQA